MFPEAELNRSFSKIVIPTWILFHFVYAICADECTPDISPRMEFHVDSNEYTKTIAMSEDFVVASDPGLTPGRVHVFNAKTGLLLRTLVSPMPSSSEQFGISVAIEGGNIVVGDLYEDLQGIVYVFDSITGALLHTFSNPGIDPVGDHFGFSVGISGNLVLVGAPFGGPKQHPRDWDGPGIAYVFDASTGNLISTLYNPNPADYNSYTDLFGLSVAISGTLVVVGAPYDGTIPLYDGNAYVFDAMTGNLISTLENTIGGWFGVSVSISGARIAVGAPLHDAFEGAVGIFDAMTGAMEHFLEEHVLESNDEFGSSVSLSENILLVGAPGTMLSWNDLFAGGAYIYNASTGKRIAALIEPMPAYAHEFGVQVAAHQQFGLIATDANYTIYHYSFDQAALASHTIPPTLPAGHATEAKISFCNTGAMEWRSDAGYALKVMADTCGISSGTLIGLDPDITVAPGATHSFSAIVEASTGTSPCALSFQMVHDGTSFGDVCAFSPDVVPAFDDADIVSHTIPATMSPGQELWVGVTMRNTGNTMWIPNTNHSLGVFGSDDCELFAQTRFAPFEAVLPNKTHQFMVRVAAPVAPGSCKFTLRMVEELEEWFGDPLSFTINVAEPANATTDWEIYQ